MGDISNLNVSWRTLLLFACCFPIVLIAFHLIRQELESQACRFWASFALLFALGITPQIIGFSGFYQVWPGLTFAPFNSDLWLGPLMLLHLRRLCLTETTFSNGLRDLVLLIPGIIQSTYYTICFLFLGDHQAKWAFNDLVHEPYIVPIETLLLLVVTLSCLWHSYRLMQGYQAFLNQTQSQADAFVPVWFKGLLYGLLILTCTWILLEVLSLLLTDFSYTNQYPFYLLMSLIVLWCSILALTDIRSPFPKIYLVAPISDEPKSPEEAITRVIPRDSWQEKYETLHEAMTTQQWYLKPDLCLKDLAALSGTNQSYLSKTINEGSHQNFNQFVNHFRVDHARQALQKHQEIDLLTIAYDSGFNSKASFNRIFKAFTQMTPGQYRQSQQTNT